MRYLLPFAEGISMGPHKSEWINSNFLHALNLDSWKGCLLCFPRMHASHLFLYLGIVGKNINHYFFANEYCYNSSDQILHATINSMTNYLLKVETYRQSFELLQNNPSTLAAFHIHTRSWWPCFQRTSLSLQFHQTCGWNGLTVESAPRTISLSATLHISQNESVITFYMLWILTPEKDAYFVFLVCMHHICFYV